MTASFEPRDPAFEAKVRDSFTRQGIMAHLGAVLAAVAPGRVEIHLPYRPEVGQQHGYFHGGAIGTIADSAGGYAAFTLMPPGATVLTVEYKLNILAPGRGDLLIARGRVVRAGRTLTVAQAEVAVRRDGAETACALMQQTLMSLPESPDRPAG